MADRMQSLLSQAVEDQRSEQRQLAVALTEVRGQLARIVTELETLRSAGAAGGAGGAAGGSGSAEEAVATVSRDIREGVRMLAERLDAVGRSVQERGADIAEMKVAVEDLHSAVRGHTNALSGVNQALAAVPAVGERVGGLQDNLVSLHERLAGLEEVAASVDRLGQRIESADQDMRELRSAFAGTASRMAELPSRADLGAAGAQSTESLDIVAGRLARVENAIPEVLARIDAVREHLQSVQGEQPDSGTAPAAESHVVERLDAVEAALVVLTEQLTAEPEPADDAVADEGPDPVAEQLAELHEGLFGEDGIAARLDGLGVDEDALNERVAAAVADSERRLSAHMDEAVLALAEALFKTSRRPSRPAAAAPPAPAPAPAPVPVAEPTPPVADDAADELDDEDELEDEFDDEGEDEDEPDDELEDDELEDDEEPDDEADDDAADSPPQPWVPQAPPAAAPPWQMPPAAVDVPARAEEPKSARRRPWWRPGD
jgi:hypothetical protein